MNIEKELAARSGSKCEMCAAEANLNVYEVSPETSAKPDNCILLCETCNQQIDNPEIADANHWRCLNDSMWSQVPAVQVMAWRMLNRLNKEDWTHDLLDMMYLDEDGLTWAKAAGDGRAPEDITVHKDCNGVILLSGDTVTLTKDLVIKGATFAGKRGTSVRNITLVHDNPEQIEGRVNGQIIVIRTKFVKKTV